MIICLLSVAMEILGLKVHDPTNRLVNEPKKVVGILVVGGVETLVKKTILLNDVISDEKKIPAADPVIAFKPMDHTRTRVSLGFGMHLGKKPGTESNVVVHDDPERRLEIALDHEVP